MFGRFSSDHGMLSRPQERLHVRVLAIAIAIVLVVLLAVQGSQFLSVTNFQSMAFQSAELGLLTLAMALAILLAGIDLSILAIANLSAIAVASYLKSVDGAAFGLFDVGIAVMIAIVVGVVCGAINGLLIGFLSVPAILATLATMTLYGGFAIGFTGGSAISAMPEGFAVLGNGTLFGVPVPLLIFLLFGLGLWLILEKTILGTEMYCVGSNPKASLYSGIDIRWVYFKTHTLIGVIAAITGLVILSRTNSANPDYGSSYILSTILIVALGGISVLGGKGKISGVILAIALLQLFSTGLNMMLYKTSGSNFLKDVIWGLLLLFVIAVMHFFQQQGRK
ncbi:ABC transporter permease [Vibrio tarriae]|uniref:ABC transporter permease n=1 Tax=Vibrio tarriae TaxID=2014742 RepID=A0AAU8WI83_9VIBR|nr:ABC transporter permease [Vibrio tarriae]QEO47237.1 ABC transporter permease [Vibrio cholerae]ASK53783.1 ABC transporter permease [Vibrio tarriae]RBM26947.1 ABC transporter permease [Vibrio tarriae]RBM31565.1 ABC transporter permease [Vibrio tarriae]RBM34267.1 ABC transporter permease [Vibrio tarriae]